MIFGAGRWRHVSLTRRVVWTFTATVAILMALQALLAFFTMKSQEDDMTDDMLRGEIQQLIALSLRPGLMPVGRLEASPHVTAFLTREALGASEVPPALRDLGPGLYQLSPGDSEWHVAVVDTEDGRLRVVLDATEFESRVNRFGYSVAALWLACVIATMLVARFVAAIAVGPIVEATRSIARLAPRRDEPTGAYPPDEAGVLMETFNRFRDRVDETVAREREFAANLDHEIRTPLTAIRTDAELIAIEAPLLPGQQKRIDRILGSVDEIIATTRSTVASISGAPVSLEPIDLRELVAGACESLADRAEVARLRIQLAVEPGQRMDTDPQALLVVCRNIVRNAIEHAAPATLRIAGDARWLVFSDDGPGIEADLLPHLFERYHQGHRSDDAAAGAPATRRGLGLAIARRFCDLRGWRLRVESPLAAGRGTAFILELDATA